jgi:hypothetical protein
MNHSLLGRYLSGSAGKVTNKKPAVFSTSSRQIGFEFPVFAYIKWSLSTRLFPGIFPD